MNHDTKKNRVSEPVQVYLDAADRSRLEHLTASLHLTKSDVLRQALRTLEAQVSSPASHPALRVAGLADAESVPGSGDAAREHDQMLADEEVRSWDA
ncbi:MAG: ribbon-helix-helix protein, CopG family [Gemmatimonadales bacterium]